MRRLLAGVLLPLVLGVGCVNTGAENDPEIPDELVRRSVQAMSLSTLVGAELSSVISSPPAGFASCPGVVQDDDSWMFDYGVDGCVPDSGLTTDTVLGVIEVTVAEGSGAFIGTFTEMGVTESVLSGSITGDTSAAGDLLSADLELTGGAWMRGTATFSLDAFFEITGTADEVSLFVDGAQLGGAEDVPLLIDVDDAVTPSAGLVGCAVPAGGRMTLFRDAARADMTFSADSHASGNITANFSDRDPAPVTACTN